MTYHERPRAPLSWPGLCRYRVMFVDFVSDQRYNSHHPMPPEPRWQSPREGARWKEDIMAEYGEWHRKGATLSDVTATAEYSVERDVIVKGIQTGKLEYREGSVWGNPYLRVLRSQLEHYLAEELGEHYVHRVKHQTELRKVKKAIAALQKQLAGLQKRQQELEASLGT